MNLELCTGIIGIFLLLQEPLKSILRVGRLEPALRNCFGGNYWNFYYKKSNPGGSLLSHALDFNKKEKFWHILDLFGGYFFISSLSLVKDRTQLHGVVPGIGLGAHFPMDLGVWSSSSWDLWAGCSKVVLESPEISKEKAIPGWEWTFSSRKGYSKPRGNILIREWIF